MNLGIAVGDAPERVAANGRRFAAACGATPVFLRQVHGDARGPDRCGRCTAGRAGARGRRQRHHRARHRLHGAGRRLPAGAVRRARAAAASAAAHAGWRGLAAGVLEATVAGAVRGGGLPTATSSTPGSAPASGRALRGRRRRARGLRRRSWRAGSRARFAPAPPGKWLADLAGLARDRLAAAGVERVSAAAGCAFEDASRFFSFRRDRVTGRMAAAVWIRGPPSAEASSAAGGRARRAGVPSR